MKENAIKIAENERLLGKNMVTHSFTLNKLSQPFTKIEIHYLSPLEFTTQEEEVILYIPTLPLQHG